MWPLYVLLSLLLIYLGVIFYLGSQMYHLAISRRSKVDLAAHDIVSPDQAGLLEWFTSGKAIFEQLPYEELELKKDQLNLRAVYLPADPAQPKSEFHGLVAVLLHGWRESKNSRMRRGLDYHAAGFDVLIPDLRAHGASNGEQIDMGCLHRDDMLAWIELVRRRPSAEDSAPPRGFILDGLSMGAATVLTLAGDDLPDDIRAIIADCGYSSMWEQGNWMLRQLTPLLRYPVLWFCFLRARIAMGANFYRQTPYEQVQKARLPLFIIHGNADSFVPVSMGVKLHNACTAKNKELWIVDGAEHGISACLNPAEYDRRCLEFIRSSLTSQSF